MRNHRLASLVLLLTAAGAAWALKVGDPAPKLMIKPLNRDGDAYDLVKSTNGSCGVVFVNPLKADDENVVKMISLIEVIHRAVDKPDKPSGAALVFVASHELDNNVKEFITQAKLTMPVAVVPADELKDWELPDPLKCIFYSTEDTKIERIYTDADKMEADLKKEAGN